MEIVIAGGGADADYDNLVEASVEQFEKGRINMVELDIY